jgi:hypothetical protein
MNLELPEILQPTLFREYDDGRPNTEGLNSDSFQITHKHNFFLSVLLDVVSKLSVFMRFLIPYDSTASNIALAIASPVLAPS